MTVIWQIWREKFKMAIEEDIVVEKKINLPWVEKYRPAKLNELISHEDIINTINKFIQEDRLPHLLFYGPPGTGKTSTILACAKQIYSQKEFGSMVLELNASDDRGIGVVRQQILNFASTRTIFKSGFKLVILDEADAMTQDAQNALRRDINKLKTLKGLALQDILNQVHLYIHRIEFSPNVKIYLLDKMADIE
ncbi:replication factor C subunit 5-like [Centruroides sculpturatus]|uniref:replication factor C subunit 5-like n=1 Tax=Centruroides sculpturatus TaxID=218467 RepID=UPI000C6E3C51|nr:replication factor C subunit 5-like [Centruroides sculpturatus]